MNNKIIKNKRIVTGLHILGEIYTKDIQGLKALTKTRKNISTIINYSLSNQTYEKHHSILSLL